MLRSRVRRGYAALAALLLPIFIGSVPPDQGTPVTVVLVVRHAEKATGSGDVPLSKSGEQRASALADLGRAAGVDAVITTQYLRTRQTAAPLATAVHAIPRVVPVQSDVAANARATADVVLHQLVGRTVLIVGHSNTVPAIVAALGGPRVAELCDEEYDALFVLVISAGAPTRTVESRYGAPSPLAGCGQMRRGDLRRGREEENRP